MLAAVSSFGAALAFSTFFTAQPAFPRGARTLSYLAWSYAAFVACMLTTFIWQVVLMSDFYGFEGRLYRSKTAIILAVTAAFATIAAGVIFLALSLTENEALAVRTAGYAVVGVIAFAIFTGLIRLCLTVLRRARFDVEYSNFNAL